VAEFEEGTQADVVCVWIGFSGRLVDADDAFGGTDADFGWVWEGEGGEWECDADECYGAGGGEEEAGEGGGGGE
jgi:hypothetical protein